MTNPTTRTGLGLALAVVVAGLGGAARAQEAPDIDLNDLTPPDLGAPRSEREYRTCPDREDPPAWTENLEGWETGRSALLSEIYEARTYEAIVATSDCSCAVKAPPWDEADAEYQENYGALDLAQVAEVRRDFSRLSRTLYQDVRRICREQGNW